MKTIFDILRGVVIGLANIIPGVSGGTMMVSMGIYDTIIGCINSLFKDFKRCVKMLWPYALGMVLGILGLAKLITFLLDYVSAADEHGVYRSDSRRPADDCSRR